MKFQHLILPFLLWLVVGVYFFFFVPTTPLIIGGAVILIFIASYFSVRVATHSKLTFIIPFCISLFLLSSILSGFSLINLVLIVAIGTLISFLTTV